ncbi:Msa family membrane protein, partial [Staphylococcus capitis]
SYIDRAQITSSDIEIKISPNMLELSQIIFLFFVYLMPQLIVVFIKHKRGENNARI